MTQQHTITLPSLNIWVALKKIGRLPIILVKFKLTPFTLDKNIKIDKSFHQYY